MNHLTFFLIYENVSDEPSYQKQYINPIDLYVLNVFSYIKLLTKRLKMFHRIVSFIYSSIMIYHSSMQFKLVYTQQFIVYICIFYKFSSSRAQLESDYLVNGLFYTDEYFSWYKFDHINQSSFQYKF